MTCCRQKIAYLAFCRHPLLDQDWTYPSLCVCNHIDAVRGRVASCVPYPTNEAIQQLIPLADELARIVGWSPRYSYGEVIRGYTGKKRKRYQRAYAKLRTKGFSTNVFSFVKSEPIKYDVSKPRPDNRLIQFWSYTYMLELSTYLKPAEEKLISSVGDGVIYPEHRFIAKGLNMQERGQLVHDIFMSIPDCHVLELDASRFDAHITRDLLKLEFRVWEAVTAPGAGDLLRHQLKIRGSFRAGKGGGVYEVDGGRTSGTPNTGSGNSIIMSLLLSAFCGYLRSNGAPKATFLVDGDDSLVFVQGPPPPVDIKHWFMLRGMTMKVDNITSDINCIGFCQSKLMRVGGCWTFIRDPKRVISRFLVTTKHTDNSIFKILFSSAQGELSINSGVPVLQEFFLAVQSWVRKWSPYKSLLIRDLSALGYRFENVLDKGWMHAKSQPITSDARIQFARSFGIGVKTQKMLENKFRRMDQVPWSFKPGMGLNEFWVFDPVRPDRWL